MRKLTTPICERAYVIICCDFGTQRSVLYHIYISHSICTSIFFQNIYCSLNNSLLAFSAFAKLTAQKLCGWDLNEHRVVTYTFDTADRDDIVFLFAKRIKRSVIVRNYDRAKAIIFDADLKITDMSELLSVAQVNNIHTAKLIKSYFFHKKILRKYHRLIYIKKYDISEGFIQLYLSVSITFDVKFAVLKHKMCGRKLMLIIRYYRLCKLILDVLLYISSHISCAVNGRI